MGIGSAGSVLVSLHGDGALDDLMPALVCG
jgi:hypothetical protein